MDCTHGKRVKGCENCEAEIAAMEASSAKSDLLQRLGVALDDWTKCYAPEFCDPKSVEETHKRIAKNGGTLAYIAKLRQEIREAL